MEQGKGVPVHRSSQAAAGPASCVAGGAEHAAHRKHLAEFVCGAE
jgi:hypothetical protein